MALVAVWSVGCAVGTGVGLPPLPIALVFQLLAATIPAGSSGIAYGPALLNTQGSGGAVVTLSSCQFFSPTGTSPGSNVVPLGLQIGVGGGMTGNASQCVLFGTIDPAVMPGSYTFTVRAADNSSPPQTDDETYTITISSLQITTVFGTPNPSVTGEAITIGWTYGTQGTAAVPSLDARVDLVDNATMVTQGSCTGPLETNQGAPTGGGSCTMTIVGLTAGAKTLVLIYPDSGIDGNFQGGAAGSGMHTVNPANTSIVPSGGGASEFQEPVTFTATVNITPPGGAGSIGLIGTVDFVDTITATPLCTGVALSGTASGSMASCMVSGLGVGGHNIQATYSGDANFNTSMAAAAHTVNQASTATMVSSMSTTGGGMSVFQESVTFTATVSLAGAGGDTPIGFSGVVNFFDTATMLPLSGCTSLALSGTLSGSTATCIVSDLAVGAHNVQATYDSGNTDPNFATSMGALAHTVNQANTTTALLSSVNPSDFGDPVTFTATVAAVAPGSTAPIGATGTVNFVDTSTATNLCLGVAINAAFQAQCMVPPPVLAAGNHDIVATYSGDMNFAGSANAPLTQVISQSTSNTALMSSAAATVFQEAVTFTATVTAGSGMGTPTGNVTFVDATTMMNLSCGVQMLVGGVATCMVSDLSVGMHNIRADYAGDANFSASMSPLLGHTVNQATTTTMLMSSLNPSAFGDNVTFTATVTVNAPGMGAPIAPGGAVTFMDTSLGVNVCTGVALAAGTATCMTNTLAVGNHDIVAAYGGDMNFAGSANAPLTQVVTAGTTATMLASNINPSTFGETVTFTATVNITAGSGPLTGTVTFLDGAVAIANCSNVALSGMTSGSTATCMVPNAMATALTAGGHNIQATYGSDPNFGGSTSNIVAQTVNQSGTMSALMSSVNPTVFLQAVTFTATVTAVPPGAGTPTGTVTFTDTTTMMNLSCGVLGTVGLAGGVAMCTVSDLQAGMHNIQATYSGDANFSGSISNVVAQTVNPNSMTALMSSSNPSEFQEMISLTATVTPVPPAMGTPTGTVNFFDTTAGMSVSGCGAVPLAAGIAICNVASLTVGPHNIRADYGGDVNFSTSMSNVVAQVVTTAATSSLLAVTAGPTPMSTVGDSLTFTALLLVNGPGSGAPIQPTGTVTFVNTTTMTNIVGCVNVALNVATQDAMCTTAALPAGMNDIQATYSGDTNFAGNMSNLYTQTVNQATPTVALMSSVSPSQFQQTVTFTATVTGGGPTPTGTVTFFNVTTATNVAGCVNVALMAGVATCMTNTLPVGMTDLRADYSGDANYAAAMSPNLTQTVITAVTTTTVTADFDPSVFGQTVTFTATITTPVGGVTPVNPTGTVDFFNGGVAIAGCAAVAINASQQATCMDSTLAVGMHNITADYTSGDTNFASSMSAIHVQDVNQATVNFAFAFNILGTPVPPNPVNGQQFTVEITLTAAAPGMGTPGGTVDVMDDLGNMCTAQIMLAGGTGTCDITSTAGGLRTITATYSGDANFAGGSDTGTITIDPAMTAVSVTADSTDPSDTGILYQIDVVVDTQGPGTGVPPGTVTVTDPDPVTGPNTCIVTLVAGPGPNQSSGNCSLASRVRGITTGPNSGRQFNLTVDYTPTNAADFATSTDSSELHEVIRGGTGIPTINITPEPSVVGELYTVDAAVNVNTGAGTPTALVTVNDGEGNMCTFDPSVATSCMLATFTAGVGKTITATFPNTDPEFTGASNNASHDVNAADTTTTITSPADMSTVVASQAFLVTWSVTANLPGGGTPNTTSTVTVQDTVATGQNCTALVSAGGCMLTLTNTGARLIEAIYSGNADYNTSTSTAITLNVIAVSIAATPAAPGGVMGNGTEDIVVGGGTGPDGMLATMDDADGVKFQITGVPAMMAPFFSCALSPASPGPLPAGVTVTAASVTLSTGQHACQLAGTPAIGSMGAYMFTIRVTDSMMNTADTPVITWMINGQLFNMSAANPGDAVDQRDYNTMLSASGGQAPLSFDDNSGTLAADVDCVDSAGGVQFAYMLAASGDLTATPVRLSDEGGADAVCNFTSRVLATATSSTGRGPTGTATELVAHSITTQPALSFVTTAIPNAKKGLEYFPASVGGQPGAVIQTNGGTGTHFFDVTSGPFTLQNIMGTDTWVGGMECADFSFPRDAAMILSSGALDTLVAATTITRPTAFNDFSDTCSFTVQINDTGSGPTGPDLTPPTQAFSIIMFNAMAVIGGSAEVINTETNQLVTSVNIGGTADQVAITRDGRWAYLTMPAIDQVAILDMSTGAPAASSPVDLSASCNEPTGIATTRVPVMGVPTDRLFVVCSTDETVDFFDINPATGAIAASGTAQVSFAGGGTDRPERVAVSPDGLRAAVSIDEGAGNAGRWEDIDTIGLTSTSRAFPGGGPDCDEPLGATWTPNGGEIWFACEDDDAISIVSSSTNMQVAQPSVAAGGAPNSIGFTPNGAFAYVTLPGTDQVAVINTTTRAVTTVNLPTPGMAVDPDSEPVGVTIPETMGTVECFITLSGAAAPSPGVAVWNDNAGAPTAGTNNTINLTGGTNPGGIAHIPIPR
jgi:hypothetical protein